jgi:hypothetical protein
MLRVAGNWFAISQFSGTRSPNLHMLVSSLRRGRSPFGTTKSCVFSSWVIEVEKSAVLRKYTGLHGPAHVSSECGNVSEQQNMHSRTDTIKPDQKKDTCNFCR